MPQRSVNNWKCVWGGQPTFSSSLPMRPINPPALISLPIFQSGIESIERCPYKVQKGIPLSVLCRKITTGP